MEITIQVLSTFEPDFSSNQCPVTCFCIYTKLLKKVQCPYYRRSQAEQRHNDYRLTLRKWECGLMIIYSKLHFLMCADRAVDLTDKDIHLQKRSRKRRSVNERKEYFVVRIIVWMIWCEHRMHYCGNGLFHEKNTPSLISYIYLYGICKAHILVTHQKKRLIFLRFIIPFLRKTVWGTINSSWS